ncbi:TerB family tellurite resistance protein [Primorskyibacter flagellatus]|uniref:tellurite resistance TerB family protein n=1 Tax=Primorskyibacter flagellatus TaxID=1387277 RepID=UPI003A92B1ED
MFESLLAFLQNPTGYQTPLPEADARHAMGALMVRAAKADKAYLFEEISLIDRVLAKRHDINAVEAAKLRAACEKLESGMPDTAEMTAILRDAISSEEREATLAALWAVVYADGIRHEEEDVLLHQIEEVLGISPDRAKALQLQAKS